ncbi:hypothetical protein J2790_004268 [Paenarthrobacter nicotinovorans]|uniref:hypothetical protein n=1 Tax=Micrococcaceae TaxID=1268 RepID=UPI00087621B3|nr:MULTISPECIES: hypothetical protein [Micrococcaceae]MDR6439093.1 hypothetical protein [Paenarthrobacter nicotinovorans]SCZ65345.1 hypothetical protein SAMN02799638_04157 [Arthrobacter sp. UNCCL28]
MPLNDPTALNPLYELELQERPHLVEAATSESLPPTMWATGDLPPFTASGLDPEMLRHVPWQARHAAAAEPDRAKVLGMIENYQGGNEQEIIGIEHEGLAAYRQRMNDWLSGKNRPKDKPLTAEEADELYKSVYGG